MSDTIDIAGLEVRAFHGFYSEERRAGQVFILDITLFLDLSAAGQNDDLARTVNYAEVVERAIALFTERAFRLIEAAAQHVVAGLLAEFPLVERVRLRLRKPDAPIAAVFEHVACTIERQRHG